MTLIGPIRSLRCMPFVESPTSRLNGWSAPTNSETRDCLRSRPIRCSKASDTTQDTPHFSRKCVCRHNGVVSLRHGYQPVFFTSASDVGGGAPRLSSFWTAHCCREVRTYLDFAAGSNPATIVQLMC